MYILIISNFITLILLVWFKSDAIVQWGELLGLSKPLKIKEFYQTRIECIPNDLNYPSFLRDYHNNFLTRLISCPLCFSLWLSIIFCLIFSITTINNLHFIMLLFIPTICIISLITYGIVIKLYEYK